MSIFPYSTSLACFTLIGSGFHKIPVGIRCNRLEVGMGSNARPLGYSIQDLSYPYPIPLLAYASYK